MLDRHVHTVDVAQDAAAQFFDCLGEALDLTDRHAELFIEPGSDHHVIRGNRRQHSRMME